MPDEQAQPTGTPATMPQSESPCRFLSKLRWQLQKAGQEHDTINEEIERLHPGLIAEVDRQRAQFEAERMERERRYEERRRADNREHLRKVKWPKLAGRFAGCTLENFAEHGSEEERAAQRRVVNALQGFRLGRIFEAGQNLLFIGPCGSGKDHLMHALAAQCLLPLGGFLDIKNGAALRRELRSASLSGGERGYIATLVRMKLLCLSDPIPAAGDALTDFQADAMYQIINERWMARKSTWATLNLPLTQLRETAERVLSGPTWDRLKDNAVIVKCDWRSYRKPLEVIG